MSKKIYDDLFDNLPLYPTYIQLPMVDQSLSFPKGMVKDGMIRIQDKYIPVDFLVLDKHRDDESPILVGRPFLYTANTVIYIGSGQIHFNLPTKKVCCQFITLFNHEHIKKQRNRRRRQACCQAVQQEETVQAPRWCEWEEEAKRMDQITKAQKEEIQGKLE